CRHLGLEAEIVVSSEREFDYAEVRDAGDWALRHCVQLGATELINPAAGAALFEPDKLASRGIWLSFLKCDDVVYEHPCGFEPRLSIIDVLMFNGIDGTRELLGRYSLAVAGAPPRPGAGRPAGGAMAARSAG